jgi:spore germination cell wall hydrolase CwlJ-like protein
VHRRLVTRLLAATSRDKRSFLSPLIIGLGIWVGFPTVAAYQDMAGLVSGIEKSGTRWNVFVEKSVAGSVHAAEMPFVDGDITTGSISGSGVESDELGAVSLRGKGNRLSAVPDEDRIVRSGKQDRIIKVMPVAPPRTFDAGSMFKKTSMLLRPAHDVRMAFARTEIRGKEVEIAGSFYMKKQKVDPGVPPMLASLVTNEKSDILATAYAPAAPDYAKASPFESLLQDPAEKDSGRFIPPVAKGDHAWMSRPLPAEVFSKAEQKCLATGIYFEARGEKLRGQAAVAQVILNRVRNPTYPDSICGVVYQNDGWLNRCQFSFACDGKRDRITNPANYKTAQEIAMAVTAGKIFIPEVGSATHYHATYVAPRWANTMKKMKKIGLHVFYRTYGGGWS